MTNLDANQHIEILGALTGGKRFEALVTELMFENYFSDRFSKDVAFGVIKVSGSDSNNDFYYFSNDESSYPRALDNLAFCNKVNVYIVSANVSSPVTSTEEGLEIDTDLTFGACKIHAKGQISAGIEKANELNRKLKNGIKNFNLRKSSDFDISGYLQSASNDQVRKLIFNRLLLDVVFSKDFPVDIDVIDLCHYGLVFYEFKRKTAAKNLISLSTPLITIGDLRRTQGQIKEAVSKMPDTGSYKENFSFLASQTGETLESEECFSLDFSHASTLLLCKELNIRYVYIIWEQERMDVFKLISPDLLPCSKFLSFLKLQPTFIDGFTFTMPKDSGDVGSRARNYKQKPRIQYVFKKDRFVPIKPAK
jgi:hypothetical protein